MLARRFPCFFTMVFVHFCQQKYLIFTKTTKTLDTFRQIWTSLIFKTAACLSLPFLCSSSGLFTRPVSLKKRGFRARHSEILIPAPPGSRCDPKFNKTIEFVQQKLASGLKTIGFLILFEGPPRGPQEGPRRDPRGPKFRLPQEAPQEAPKRPPRGPQEDPKRPPRVITSNN